MWLYDHCITISIKRIHCIVFNLQDLRRLLTSHEDTSSPVSLESAREAQAKVSSRVKEKDVKEVEGVGISPSPKGYGVKINLSAPISKEIEKDLTKPIGNVLVTVQVTGRASAF
jgi:hypothetical protein